MRIELTRDLSAHRAGTVLDVAEDVGRYVVAAGYAAELPLVAVGGPGFDPGAEGLEPAGSVIGHE